MKDIDPKTSQVNSIKKSRTEHEQWLHMYRQMLKIRKFEENVNQLYTTAKMPGLSHLSIGQEAVAVGVCESIRSDDYITSTHRGHGHILARGGVEFLAVFLGIALSLWVDDYREEKELSDRITDDYENIYYEVKSNIRIIEGIISQNIDINLYEEKILEILNRDVTYKQDDVIKLVSNIFSLTFFGETSAHRTSVASGRFNSSRNDTLTKQISKLYEHYFVRLNKNGSWVDDVFSQGHTIPFYAAIYNVNNLDSLTIKKYFFSDTFQNNFLFFRFARSIYMMRLEETQNQLYKVKNSLEHFLIEPSFNLGIEF